MASGLTPIAVNGARMPVLMVYCWTTVVLLAVPGGGGEDSHRWSMPSVANPLGPRVLSSRIGEQPPGTQAPTLYRVSTPLLSPTYRSAVAGKPPAAGLTTMPSPKTGTSRVVFARKSTPWVVVLGAEALFTRAIWVLAPILRVRKPTYSASVRGSRATASARCPSRPRPVPTSPAAITWGVDRVSVAGSKVNRTTPTLFEPPSAT